MDDLAVDRAPGHLPTQSFASPALMSGQLNTLARFSSIMPQPWLATRRRRRILFLSLAAPGFVAVFATPLHGQFFIMVAGFLLFAAAVLFRTLTEPLFARADAAGLLPPLPFSVPETKDSSNA